MSFLSCPHLPTRPITSAVVSCEVSLTMRKMLENSKNITFAENIVQIKSALNETSIAAIDALCDELCG